MFYSRFYSRIRNNDQTVFDGLNSLIARNNKPAHIPAFWVIFVSIAIALLVITLGKTYGLLNYRLTSISAYLC